MWSQPKYIIIVLLAVMAGPAWCAEMGAAAIDSAEPTKKTLSNEKPTPAGVRLGPDLPRVPAPGRISSVPSSRCGHMHGQGIATTLTIR
jgi:hypothetical protein